MINDSVAGNYLLLILPRMRVRNHAAKAKPVNRNCDDKLKNSKKHFFAPFSDEAGWLRPVIIMIKSLYAAYPEWCSKTHELYKLQTLQQQQFSQNFQFSQRMNMSTEQYEREAYEIAPEPLPMPLWFIEMLHNRKIYIYIKRHIEYFRQAHSCGTVSRIRLWHGWRTLFAAIPDCYCCCHHNKSPL